MSRPVRELTTELERAALRELCRVYGDLNATHFGRRLEAVVLRLTDATTELGRWRRDSRTIELSRSLLEQLGWDAVLEVLKHEMAHQYVDEVLGVVDEPAHGPAFREVCERRAIDSRAGGLPKTGPSCAEQHLLERVAKLLALAQSTNEHEAHSAMSAAQRLMLKYNLEELSRGDAGRYGYRTLGLPSGRIDESQRILAMILAEHFFVETIWVPVWRPLEGKRGSVLEICGTSQNLELAEYVHSFLMGTAQRLWKQYREEFMIAGNAQRRSYIAGVMAGFKDKLERERAKNKAHGLVWVGDKDLDDFFRKRHPRVRWARYGPRRRPAAYGDGRVAGQQIVLHRGVGGSPATPVRQLPPRR
jgi:hypothetical protein